jgi:coniferyl-aldehyde dehydrogenase|tara:strand:+ start:1978 stop:3363 length:1386 start_codon:yes stop_codon:yes gene_type:complete
LLSEQSSCAYLNQQFNELTGLVRNSPFINYNVRRNTLLTLKKLLIKNHVELCDSLNQDYGHRPYFDSLAGDILSTISSINYTVKQLNKWMRPSKRQSGAVVRYQALGIVGIICPWNFPISLSMIPAIQALAAGNRVLIKISELNPNTGKLLCKLCQPLSPFIRIIQGDSSVGMHFSTLKFNHLVFTGSASTGRKVMAAAAKNLTPVTLELGGKSPVIIDETARLSQCIHAIIFGKIFNAGQVCIAPDYVFIIDNRLNLFIQKIIKAYTQHYNSKRVTTIISNYHANRIQKLLDDAKLKGAKIYTIPISRQLSPHEIPPSIITNTNDTMAIMHEEIFGPLLIVKPYTSLQQVIKYINQRPSPLALYIMSTNTSTINTLLDNTHSGGVSVNDCFVHASINDAPFGGIGESGMGHYKGKEGFLTFSKAKTVFYTSRWSIKNNSILVCRSFITTLLRFILRAQSR